MFSSPLALVHRLPTQFDTHFLVHLLLENETAPKKSIQFDTTPPHRSSFVGVQTTRRMVLHSASVAHASHRQSSQPLVQFVPGPILKSLHHQSHADTQPERVRRARQSPRLATHRRSHAHLRFHPKGDPQRPSLLEYPDFLPRLRHGNLPTL